ncbi:tripartite tricarboxylate transporter TctB family protein [Histidinibacterium aquaticum]|uniref:tripartite tricarboxylate transporter TctB family protein n=1 Tax=Histidinibacterium aquaticum TaxID=2613962 RepID=UPI00168A401D|nr:tripartite tricarboxylate transporter TctB family protein [Histidinibacterium aquaticum]
MAVALILVGATAIYLSQGFRGDAGFFPTAMGCLLIVASLVLIAQTVLRKSAPAEPDDAFEGKRFLTWIGLALLLFMIVWQVDFYLGVFGFIVASYLILAKKGVVFSVTLAAIFTIILFVGFDLLLNVPTPSRLQAFFNTF